MAKQQSDELLTDFISLFTHESSKGVHESIFVYEFIQTLARKIVMVASEEGPNMLVKVDWEGQLIYFDWGNH